MHPTNSAELLYDSEITLRMVDEVLDELGTSEPEGLPSHPATAQLPAHDRTGADPIPRHPEIFWQIEEALEEIRSARMKVSECGATSGAELSALLVALLASTEARLSRLARRLAG